MPSRSSCRSFFSHRHPVFTVFFVLEDLLAQAGVLDDGFVSDRVVYFVYLAWVGLVFIAALIVVGGRDVRRLAVAALVLLAVAALPQAYLPYADLWAPHDEIPATEDLPSVASEEVLNRQSRAARPRAAIALARAARHRGSLLRRLRRLRRAGRVHEGSRPPRAT